MDFFTWTLRRITFERLSRGRVRLHVEELTIPFITTFGLGFDPFGGGYRLPSADDSDSDDDDFLARANYRRRHDLRNSRSIAFQEDYLTGDDITPNDPDELRSYHKRQISRMEEEEISIYNISNLTNMTHVSTTPLENLKLTSIVDLKINIPAKGSYLLLRTIEKPVNASGITTVVEDHVGTVCLLSILNLLSPDFENHPEYILPVGARLVLKEPVCMYYQHNRYMLCSESPTNAIVIQRQGPLLSLVENVQWCNKVPLSIRNYPEPAKPTEWKAEGRELFLRGKLRSAVEAYHLGLQMTRPEDKKGAVILQICLAETYLELGYFEKALEFTEKALLVETSNRKALLHSGKGNYLLRRYKEAHKQFQKLRKLDPFNKETVTEIKRCEMRIAEQRGEIEIYNLYQRSVSQPKTPLDFGDYEGPVIITPIVGKGNGMVVTKDVKQGTLLLASKALVAVFENPTKHANHFGIDSSKYEVDPNLVKMTAQAILRNPNTFGTKLYALKSSECAQSTNKLFCDERTREEPIVDIKLITSILKENIFLIEPYCKEFGFLEGEIHGSGLFPMPSYINHSCLPNASYITFNDILLVHAVRDIKCGEEITIPYVQPTCNYSEKAAHFLSRKFRCTCPICELDRKEPPDVTTERENALFEVEKKFPKYFGSESFDDGHSAFHSQAELKYLIKTIQKSYRKSGRKDHKISLALPYICLFKLHFRKGKIQNVLNYLWDAITALGFEPKTMPMCCKDGEINIPPDALLIPFTLFPIQLVISYYKAVDKDSEAEKWIEVLASLENVLTGANKFMIQEKFRLDSSKIPHTG